VSIAAAATCAVAMLDTNVRASLVALVAALALVLLLYQAARGFEGLHLGVTALVLAVIAIGGVGAYAIVTGGSDTARARFSSVLNPTQDAAYQARRFKWESALSDIAHHPTGHGLGTAGRVQVRYGRFLNVASKDIDSSYLKIAWEQGFAVMVFFIVAMLLLLYGLARGAVATRERHAAGLAIGACGSLVALLVLFFAGVYIEGLTALAGWTIVGVGAGPFATPER
jgi:cell division protein FtsW (lipid II flippase)